MFRDRVLQHYREKGYSLRERVKVRGQSGAVHACDLVAQGPLGNLVVQFEDYGGFEGPELEAVRRIARDVGAVPVVAAEHVSDTIRRHALRNSVVVLDAAALEAPRPRAVEVVAGSAQQTHPWPDPDRPRQATKRSGPVDGHAEGRTGEPATRARSGEPAASTAWPADGRAHPEASSRMDPGDVDDLVSEWRDRKEPRRTRREDPGFWKYGRDDGPPASGAVTVQERPRAAQGFGWLEGPDAPAIADVGTAAEPARPAAVAPLGAPGSDLDDRTAPFIAPVRSSRTATTEASAQRPVLRPWVRALLGYAVAGASAGAAFLGLGLLFGAF